MARKRKLGYRKFQVQLLKGGTRLFIAEQQTSHKWTGYYDDNHAVEGEATSLRELLGDMGVCIGGDVQKVTESGITTSKPLYKVAM